MQPRERLEAMLGAGQGISICDNCLCCNECEDPQLGCYQRDLETGTITPRQYGNGQWVIVANYQDSRESARIRAIQLTHMINAFPALAKCLLAVMDRCNLVIASSWNGGNSDQLAEARTILAIINRELGE